MRKIQISSFSVIVLAVALSTIVLLSAAPVSAQSERAGFSDIDRKPTSDFVRSVRQRLQSGDLDLSHKFSFEYRFVIGPDGRLDIRQSKVLQETGDAKLTAAAADGILAMGESGYFSYLRSLNVDKGTISASQTAENFSFAINFDQKNARMAQTVVTGLRTYLQIGARQAISEEDKLILKSTTVSASEAKVTVSFTLPTSQFEQLVVGTPVND